MDKLQRLAKLIDTLDQAEESKFVELDPDDLKAFGDEAVLIELRGAEYWLPFSQLRHDDGQLYASKWILDKKEIEL